VQSQGQEDLHNPNTLLPLSACPFSTWLREECRQVKHLLSGIPMAILPLLPAKYISPYRTFPAATRR